MAYLEKRKKDIKNFSPSETIFPEELIKTPLRFAIVKRNNIMLRYADTVVTYVEGPGGAADFKRLAEDRGKRVINLYKRKSVFPVQTLIIIHSQFLLLRPTREYRLL